MRAFKLLTPGSAAQQVVQHRLEREQAVARRDPLGREDGPEREAAARARAVLEQDLVAAGVEADGVIADDPAGSQRGDVERVARQGALQLLGGLALPGVAALHDL